jgi:hypothetical protein
MILVVTIESYFGDECFERIRSSLVLFESWVLVFYGKNVNYSLHQTKSFANGLPILQTPKQIII